MAALAAVMATMGRAQIYAASADADARGAGRGVDWPTGPMPSLVAVMDFGSRAVSEGEFNWATGQAAVAEQFRAAVGDVFTTNGPAHHVYVPGARGPAPTVPCYVKAFNAAILDDELVAVKTRLMDSATVTSPASAAAPGVQVVESEAKGLAWFSVHRSPGA